MPSTYSDFDPTKPVGTDTGTVLPGTANVNDIALLVHAIIGGEMKGYVASVSVGTGTAEQPQFYLFTNGARIVRLTNTWGSAGGSAGNITTQVAEWSTDTGGTYAAVFTQTITYDSNGNVTASTGAGGQGTFMGYLLGKVKALLTAFNAHTAATGTAVHGLGNMATQSAAAVAITGGAITGTAVDATRFRGNAINLGNVTGATNIDMSLGDYFYATVTGAWVPTLINIPASGKWQGMTLELTNPGAFGITGFWATVKWPSASAPSRTVAGLDVYEFWTRDGGTTVRGAQANKDNR